MDITIHEESRDSKENENRVEEIPEDNMPLHDEIKGDDIEMQKEENVPILKQFETN